jgi:hypothetical protein
LPSLAIQNLFCAIIVIVALSINANMMNLFIAVYRLSDVFLTISNEYAMVRSFGQ